MEVLNGSDLMLFIKVGATTKTIAFATSHKVSIKMKTKPKSSKDSGIWDEITAGRLSWNISADAMTAADDNAFSYDDIKALQIARTPIDVFSTLATGSAPDWVKATTGGHTGKAYITSLDQDAKDEDNSTFSITLDGTGPYLPIA